MKHEIVSWLCSHVELFLRFGAIACLILAFTDWVIPGWQSANSLPARAVLFLVVAVYLWFVFFPKKWNAEAIGSAIGFVLGGHLIYLSKASILLVLMRPATFFHGANLFLIASAILAWVVRIRSVYLTRAFTAFLLPFGLWGLLYFIVLPVV